MSQTGKKNDKISILISSELNQPTPRRKGALWIILFSLLLVLLRIFVFPASQEDKKLSSTPPAYKVTDNEPLFHKNSQNDTDTSEKNAPVRESLPADVPENAIRVASAQIAPIFNKPEENMKKIAAFCKKAAQLKAKFIVFPEAALPGYADLDNWNLWATDAQTATKAHEFADFFPVKPAAQPIPGKATELFCKLAQELKLYIALPLIEQDKDNFYSSLVLISEEGKIILKYRKRKLWAIADMNWASPDESEMQVAQTPYARVGLSISYDLDQTYLLFKEKKTDLILHSAAFFGKKLEKWINAKYRNFAPASNSAIVLANWGSNFTPEWSGYGLSRICSRQGKLLAAEGESEGEFLLVQDVPLNDAKEPMPAENKPSEKTDDARKITE